MLLKPHISLTPIGRVATSYRAADCSRADYRLWSISWRLFLRQVDAVVNTIGFPLVGGPAGSMEAGRRVDVATNLLAAKDLPYMVAAPLLIQDLAGWRRDGVQGLQQVCTCRQRCSSLLVSVGDGATGAVRLAVAASGGGSSAAASGSWLHVSTPSLERRRGRAKNGKVGAMSILP